MWAHERAAIAMRMIVCAADFVCGKFQFTAAGGEAVNIQYARHTQSPKRPPSATKAHERDLSGLWPVGVVASLHHSIAEVKEATRPQGYFTGGEPAARPP